jgi:Spy/CpxP family protein refolding chaperone
LALVLLPLRLGTRRHVRDDGQHPLVAFAQGHVHGRHAGAVGTVDRGTAAKQQLHHVAQPQRRSNVEQRPLVAVHGRRKER